MFGSVGAAEFRLYSSLKKRMSCDPVERPM